MVLDNSVVAVITGASSGIGRALALELAARGVRLALLARRGDLLQEVAMQCRDLGADSLPIVADVTKRSQVIDAIGRAASELGEIDLLVNNAGRGHNAYIEDTPDEQIESIFRVNAFALWYTTSAVLPGMRRRDAGLIVNIASIAGKVGYPGNAVYVAAKHATVGFTRALRAELAGTGIEAMAVIPAGVSTEWAEVVEGGSLLEIFAAEHAGGLEIARQRGVEVPEPLPLLSPQQVALAIIDGISSPVPEFYTHAGTRELAVLAQSDPSQFEARQEPFQIANREAYLRGRR